MMSKARDTLPHATKLLVICSVIFVLKSGASHQRLDIDDSDKTPLQANITTGDDRWEKVLLTDAASKNGAVCLDGSPGGYYIRRRNDDRNDSVENNWIVFHQGGGWCGSNTNCLKRSKGRLGSSNFWGPTYEYGVHGFAGSELFSTPLFENYTIVYAMYCDGTSWTSDVDYPVKVSNNTNETIYFRGRRLLDALIDNLVSVEGLQNASKVLYSGCSAGALTTFLHIDYVASRLSPFSPTVKILGLADAMFSLDRNQFNGAPGGLQKSMKWGYQAWNSSYSVNTGCKKAHSKEDEWKCMIGEHVSIFVKTDLFIINSKYDTWQRKAILGADCDIGINCPKAQETFDILYGQSMVTALEKIPKEHGYFVSNCPSHCQSGLKFNWNYVTIDNVTMKDAFLMWYKQKNNPSKSDQVHIRLVDTGDAGPSGANVCPKRRSDFVADKMFQSIG
uniref:Pectin acetylesterase n=1 Tax=Ditylum brightwellii TaxID=49249 RepID=A0A7S4R4X8_9STRA